MIEDVIDVTENCRHSLMCRHVCPVGNITHRETLTPHGWAQLVASERRGLIAWNEDTVQALYACADCGSCRAHCVTSQALPEAIAAARAVVASRDLAPPVVYELAERLREWQNPHVEVPPEAVEGEGEVALFVGDEAQHLRPSALEAALELLNAVGVAPILIGKGRSSGYLASSLGLPEIARGLAESNLEELKSTGANRLLVLGPGDFFTFQQMMDERLGVRLPEGVEVLEVIPFLAEQETKGTLRLNRLQSEAATAYVDPTHAVRVKTRYAAPRRLLSAVLAEPPVELFWRDGRAYPCGNLALQFTQPDLADALTRARLEDAAGRGAEVVVTEDPGSLAHLERHAADFGLRVEGLYELLARQKA